VAAPDVALSLCVAAIRKRRMPSPSWRGIGRR
jgi:hypothetical protein